MKDIFYYRQRNFFCMVSLGILILMLCLHIRYNVGVFIGSLASISIYPLLMLFHRIELSYEHLHTKLVHTDQLHLQIDQLKAERDKLQEELITFKATLSYAKQIEFLQLTADLYNTVQVVGVVQVIMRHFAHNEHYVLIAGGTNKGIKKDMIVVHNRSLIGRVVAVYPWYSKVALVSDKTVKIPVFVGNDQVAAVYEGANDESAYIDYIEHSEMIQKDDLVLSSGQGLIFPYGFALGTVGKNQGNKIAITPFVDLKEMRYCTIIAMDTSEQKKGNS